MWIKIVFCLLLVVVSSVAESERVQLRIIQVTDVYTLENFPHLKNLIKNKTLEHGTTVSMLTGDFLMPYLLSTVDGGKGMMRMINSVPIDYLTWGNHENDLQHDKLMDRVKEYKGTWINTNMQSHDSFTQASCQKDHELIVLNNANHSRSVSILGILTNHPSLYSPGAFNGAKIEDPWETMTLYVQKMKRQGADLVIPVCHLYEDQDERTARDFQFPVILGGHDHHKLDKIINGTRLLKPGSDAHYAVVLDISWNSTNDTKPTIQAQTLRVKDFTPDQDLQAIVEDSYSVLYPLRYTQLDVVPSKYRPFTSVGARANHISVATYMCTKVREALSRKVAHCDAFLLKGGNMRGSKHYGDHEQFSLEAMMSEFDDVKVFMAWVPGSVIRIGLRETWKKPGTGWFQYDDGIELDQEGFVTRINGEPLDEERMYHIGTMDDFFRARDSPSVGAFFKDHPRPLEGYRVHNLLLDFFAQDAWNKITNKLDSNQDGKVDVGEFRCLDDNRNGRLDRKDIMGAIDRFLGFDTYDGEYTFVDYILSISGEGKDILRNQDQYEQQVRLSLSGDTLQLGDLVS